MESWLTNDTINIWMVKETEKPYYVLQNHIIGAFKVVLKEVEKTSYFGRHVERMILRTTLPGH